MATHSSILAWEIPWAEEPDWLQTVQKVRRDLAAKQQQHTFSWINVGIVYSLTIYLTQYEAI